MGVFLGQHVSSSSIIFPPILSCFCLSPSFSSLNSSSLWPVRPFSRHICYSVRQMTKVVVIVKGGLRIQKLNVTDDFSSHT